MRNTEYSLLPIFIEVYETNSFTQAASRLGLSQPTISQAIVKLRDLYNDQLFIRRSRGVTPTALADHVYPLVKASIDQINTTVSGSFNFDPRTSSRQFIIESSPSSNYIFLPKLSAHLRNISGNIKLGVRPVMQRSFEMNLRLRECDFVIDAYPTNSTNLRHKIIERDCLVVVARKGHPRIRQSITAEQYFRELHVVQSDNESISPFLDRFDYSLLSKRNIAWSAPGVLEMFNVIENTDWIGIAPYRMALKYAEVHNLHILKSPFDIKIEAAVYWHASQEVEPHHAWLRSQIDQITDFEECPIGELS